MHLSVLSCQFSNITNKQAKLSGTALWLKLIIRCCICYVLQCYVLHYYFHLIAIFPGEAGSVGLPSGLHTPPVPEEKPLGLLEWGFHAPDVLPATQPSASKHWREHKALILNSGLASSFLQPESDSSGRGIAAFMLAL